MQDKPDESTRLLNTQEVAEMLGVSRRTIEGWVHQKRIPYVKLGTSGKGSLLRFRLDSLNAWIQEREVHPDGK